jgi:hypothetical protein
MSRSSLAIAATAATLVVGLWIHAATLEVSPPASGGQPASLGPAEESGPKQAVPRAGAVATSRPKIRAKAAPRAADPSKPVVPATAPEPAAPVSRLAAGSAMRIADPSTSEIPASAPGAPMLSVEEMQELARREAEGLVTIRNADGSETLDHEGRFTDFSVVRVGPDGRPVYTCAHGQLGLDHVLRHHRVTSTMEDR